MAVTINLDSGLGGWRIFGETQDKLPRAKQWFVGVSPGKLPAVRMRINNSISKDGSIWAGGLGWPPAWAKFQYWYPFPAMAALLEHVPLLSDGDMPLKESGKPSIVALYSAITYAMKVAYGEQLYSEDPPQKIMVSVPLSVFTECDLSPQQLTKMKMNFEAFGCTWRIIDNGLSAFDQSVMLTMEQMANAKKQPPLPGLNLAAQQLWLDEAAHIDETAFTKMAKYNGTSWDLVQESKTPEPHQANYKFESVPPELGEFMVPTAWYQAEGGGYVAKKAMTITDPATGKPLNLVAGDMVWFKPAENPTTKILGMDVVADPNMQNDQIAFKPLKTGLNTTMVVNVGKPPPLESEVTAMLKDLLMDKVAEKITKEVWKGTDEGTHDGGSDD